MEEIKIRPTFIRTKNVRNFEALMDGLALGEDDSRLGLVYGRAGRGKSRTAQWYAANHGYVYMFVLTVWRTNETEFLRALCRELHIKAPPKRKNDCFLAVMDRLIDERKPVFLDEFEKLPQNYLGIIRELTETTGVPFVLIGEEELLAYMRRDSRVWSRTYQQIEFQPITESDIILYAGEAARIKLSSPVAKILLAASGGDFRIVRRDLLKLVFYANSIPTRDITEEMAQVAVKVGLQGAEENGRPPLKAV